MPYDKTSLPVPPEFPPSNASYNKIVGKMHKAALGATTAAAAITAVGMIASYVKGVNTYAKATRRYGDQLIEAIKGEPAKAKAEKPAKAKAKTVKVKTAKGDIEVDLKKLEVDPSIHPGGIKEKPAMPQLAKAAKAAVAAVAAGAEGVTVSFNDGKSFSSKSNARRALKLAACDHLPVEWEVDADSVRPILIVKDDHGVAYAAERGFKAKVTA